MAEISPTSIESAAPTRLCAVCGEVVAAARFLEVAHAETGEPFAVMRCSSCGALRTEPAPDDLRPYYASELAATMTHPGSRLFGALRMQRLGFEVRRLQRHLREHALLDIGCGTGDFALAAHRCGYDVVAADGGDAPPADIATLPGVRYVRFDFDSFALNDRGPRGPHVAVLRHVLEHVRDPMRLLNRLSEQGATAFYIVVPNAASRERRLLGRYWYSWDPPRHLWHFDEGSLRRVCQRADLVQVARGMATAPTLVPSLYRYLRLGGWPAALYEPFGPNTLFTALSAPLNLAFRHNVLWCIARPG